MLRTLPEVSAVRVRRMFVESTDGRVFFTYRGEPFVVWEMFGDNSRYWVGPEGESDQDIAKLERGVAAHRPRILRRIFGHLLTLRFLPSRE